MRRVLLGVLLSLFTAAAKAEEKPLVQPLMEWPAAQKASFVVAYVYGEPTDAELRPPSKDDPFGGTEPQAPLGILQSGKLDVAALVGLTRERARLNDAQRKELFAAVFRSTKLAPIAVCYDPHHAFVFYDEKGVPLGVIEVCMSCCIVKLTQGETLVCAPNRMVPETVDFMALARLLKNLGLSMRGYASFEEYEQSYRAKEKALEKAMEEHLKEQEKEKK